MKAIIVIAFIVPLAASAAPGDAKFTGSVYLESQEQIRVQLETPVGNDVHIRLGIGYQLQFKASSPTESKVRLLNRSGDILHESRALGPVSQRASFAYRLCGDEVTHMSPRPDQIPACSDTPKH